MVVSWLPSIPYNAPGHGFWSPVTSTLNWCEEDYYATHYIAELINSLTNLQFIYLGVKGFRNSFKNNDDPVFKLAWVSYILLGAGSFAFHATLRYSMQLVDELAMIYITSILLYSAFSYGRSTLFQIILGLGIASASIGVTVYYYYLLNPVFHQTLFAVMTAAKTFRNFYVSETALRPSRRKSDNDAAGPNVKTRRADVSQAKKDERDLVLLRRTYAMVYTGLAAVGIGFFIWNMDNIHCAMWRGLRREVGLPWGILLEGHGWWHIFTGVSLYISVMWSTWNRYCLEGKQDRFELIWPSWFIIPTIVPVKPARRSKKKD